VSIRVLAGYLVGIALGTVSVTLLFLGMRAVMERLDRALPLLIGGAGLFGIWLGAVLFSAIS
jgi:hypothetical protein